MEKNEYLAYYMEFDNKYTGKLNKYGGLPTHLPPQWPMDERLVNGHFCASSIVTEKCCPFQVLCVFMSISL